MHCAAASLFFIMRPGMYSFMKFYKNLYVSDGIKNIRKVKHKLKTGAGLIDIFCITLCSGSDQLEIFPSYVLMQPYYHKHPVYVIGIASSYQGALELVMKIAEEAYTQNGNCDLKKYLLDKERLHDQ